MSYFQIFLLLMTALIIKVSGVALLEKSLKEKKPQYKEYIEKPVLFCHGFQRRPEGSNPHDLSMPKLAERNSYIICCITKLFVIFL